MIEELLIKYFRLRVSKFSEIKNKKYSIAASIRDEEKIILKDIYLLIESQNFNFGFINQNLNTFDMDKVVSNYCESQYGCGTQDAKKILILIEREVKLRSIGLKSEESE